MTEHLLTIDADGHVLEPRDTWLDYIDPAYRDRAIRIADDDQGDEVLLVDGRPLESMRNRLAQLGGIDLDPDEVADGRRSALRGRLPARRLRPGGAPAGHGRRGHRRRAPLPDDRHLLGGSRHRSGAGDRVHPRVQPLHRRLLLARPGAARTGRPHLAHRRGRRGRRDRAAPARPVAAPSTSRPTWRRAADAASNDPAFDRFWSAAADLDMPVGFHVVVRDQAVLQLVVARRGARAASCSASRSSPST